MDTEQKDTDESLEQVEVPQDLAAQQALIEALILGNGDPLGIDRIEEIVKLSREQIDAHIDAIINKFAAPEFGFELVAVGSRYQFRTKSDYGQYLQILKSDRPRRLTHAALETLAIVAYRQPVSRGEIEKLRGVDATPTLKTLLERSLIKIAGHQETPGQPALYATTDEFLSIFGLSSLKELPTLRDLRELDQDPGETENEVGGTHSSEQPYEEQPH